MDLLFVKCFFQKFSLGNMYMNWCNKFMIGNMITGMKRILVFFPLVQSARKHKNDFFP